MSNDSEPAPAGRAVIVTGAGTGIGRATAQRFADEGASVLAVGRTGTTLAQTARDRPAIHPLVADVTDPDGPARVVDAALAVFGRIDVLVNNAAITRPAPLGQIDRADTAAQLATNLVGPVFLAQQALPHLVASSGLIVNVTSVQPFRGWPNNSVYGATKVALDFITRTWAVELAERGVRVVSVAPGVTHTPVLAHAGLSPEQIAEAGEQLRRRIPLGRLAQPEEIAWWIVRTARPEAGYLTGAVIQVDGGINVA
ncbi:NAD(P)-dependent dehydrogenase, short-chain alcohol dehydrogenase family [Goodfellowiella coeruleoviolacea]|uniref:NAD(P)-dependent dehydrogenase, short-chain alcohol dehydrogenase family n=1 Tax=Goodfellowiella coeruleoviolacea TaxID=334858 RepID=A0AAE3GKT8_9PSEU|nr:NAD(P)-dependent dehydrogenase, short-chain alcohol dehydrogenase family [Goodfellowiella coeruleoviolacea]